MNERFLEMTERDEREKEKEINKKYLDDWWKEHLNKSSFTYIVTAFWCPIIFRLQRLTIKKSAIKLKKREQRVSYFKFQANHFC
jgi:hypothetical protein